MLTITQEENGANCTLKLAGGFDTAAAKDATCVFNEAAAKCKDIILDFSEVDYIASSGLRAITQLYQKSHINNGSVTIRGANENVMEVFNMTGFTALFTFE